MKAGARNCGGIGGGTPESMMPRVRGVLGDCVLTIEEERLETLRLNWALSGMATRSSGADDRSFREEPLARWSEILGGCGMVVGLLLLAVADGWLFTRDIARLLFSASALLEEAALISPAADFRRLKLRDGILEVAASATFRSDRRFRSLESLTTTSISALP